MLDKIIEAVFDFWCESSEHEEFPEVQEAIDTLNNQYNVDSLHAEKLIMELICLYEYRAFTVGFQLCYVFLCGIKEE